jgi:hypothetical protein
MGIKLGCVPLGKPLQRCTLSFVFGVLGLDGFFIAKSLMTKT